jgi:hypothetical protein
MWLVNLWRRFRHEMEMPPNCTCGTRSPLECPVLMWLESRPAMPLPEARVL